MLKTNVAKRCTHFEVTRLSWCLKAQKGIGRQLFREVEFDDSALQVDHDSVGSVVSARFGEDASDSALRRFFGDREPRGNLFICTPARNRPQDLDCSCVQSIICDVFGNLEGDFRGKPQKGIRRQLFRELEIDDSALQADHGSMSSVISPKFGEDAPNSALHGFFGN
jgi:hypothetical protein